MIRRLATLVAILVSGWLTNGMARAQVDADATITYLTASTVYLDLGSAGGLRVGQEIEVLRSGERIAVLVVREVSARRAACATKSSSTALVIGDSVRVLGKLEPGAIPPAPVTAGSRSVGVGHGVRGSVALDLLYLRDESGFGRDLWQPAARLRLKGSRVAGSAWDFDIDVRSRRSMYRGDRERTLQRNRVYRLRVGRQYGSLRWDFGRQYSRDVGAFGIVDGGRLQWREGDWEVQLLGGMQPGGLSLDVQPDRLRGGLMFFRHGEGPSARWRVGAGYAGAYDRGNFDREFVHLDTRLRSARWTLIATQDLDVNRSWKRSLESSVLSWTRTHVHATARLGASWTVLGGFDNRRPLRRYRDFETPETAFDDRYRQGAWVGWRHRLGSGYSWGVRARARRGASRDGADAVTFDFRGSEDWSGRWGFSSRTTLYRNDLVEGWLQSARLGLTRRDGLHVALFGGLRHESGVENDLADFTDPWLGIDVERNVHRDWSVSYHLERSFEGGEAFQEHWISVLRRI